MTESEFGPGSVIGDRTVLAFCGTGAYGQVYLVRDREARRLALKVLSSDRRGKRELNGLLRFRRVAHPNLLRIGDLGTLPDGRVYYTMDAADNASGNDEAYEPDTLARRMLGSGTIPVGELRRIMLELSSGLAELHRTHLIHRDIKPENILFVGGRAVLADAGTVDDAEGASLVGTLEYLPPEVRMGKRGPTASDDCYALGKILYSALTGEAPRKFPSTPHTLGGEAVALFRVAERACTPPGVSAYRFRELLEHPERVRRRRRLPVWLTAALLCFVAAIFVVAAVLTIWPFRKERSISPERGPEPAETAAGMERVSAAYSDAFVRKIKADEARLRAEQERIKSPTVQVVGMKRRDAAEPTLSELMNKYRRTPEEERLVERWMRECVSFDRRINRAMWNRAKIAELTAEKKAKLPYGIDDFCGDEMRMRKLLDILARDYTPDKRRKLELALRYRRDSLRKLLEKLPPSELAKWR